MKAFARAAVVCALFFVAPSAEARSGSVTTDEALAALAAAYPDHISGWENGALVWRDGSRMRGSDGVEAKSRERLLDAPDLDDMFAWEYSFSHPPRPPRDDADPGRVRHEAFFRKMYGDCRRGEVAPRLVDVSWVGGRRIRATSVNGVDRALARVARDLELLPAAVIEPFVWPIGGVYACREIAGAGRMSTHAYGAAIDLNPDLGDYWRWAGGATGALPPYRNRIPSEIVEIFEIHGFIWGGRWSAFDTMHFEYRPEFMALERLR